MQFNALHGGGMGIKLELGSVGIGKDPSRIGQNHFGLVFRKDKFY
jgi:hypothetical protein